MRWSKPIGAAQKIPLGTAEPIHRAAEADFKPTARMPGGLQAMHSKVHCPPMKMLRPVLLLLSFLLLEQAGAAAPAYYDLTYRAQLRPEAKAIDVEITLQGERLPRRIVLNVDRRRHQDFRSTDPLQIESSHVRWQPRGRNSRLHYRFLVNHERSPQRYDSLMTADWAIFRTDKMVPRARVTARRNLQARASLEFVLPPGWSIATPYGSVGDLRYELNDRERRFDQPEGWALAGKLGTRNEQIGSVRVVVAAPAGDSVRRQDTLAFLQWTLPRLLEVFPQFPTRLLIVSAGDPLWRGGLSGPASAFLHADRPLISENRTSTLLHELVHIALGIRGDEESDWIVEGLAEFYSIEALRRSGSISEQRHAQAMDRLATWARRAPTLFVRHSDGATTARAVLALRAADAEIRKLTADKASLDDVAGKLAAERGTISLARLQQTAQEVAGRPLRSLERGQLTRPIAAPGG